MLTSEGLVEVRPGRGTFVAPAGSSAESRAAPLSPSDIHDLLETRQVIEGRIASLAAERADARQAEAIRAALDRMAAAVASPRMFVEADLDFHVVVSAASNNRYLHQMTLTLRDLLREDIRLSVETAFRRTGTLRPSLALHAALAERILGADPAGATQAALAILQRNEQFATGLAPGGESAGATDHAVERSAIGERV